MGSKDKENSTNRAEEILDHATKTADYFCSKVFPKGTGAPTNQEQDLLRAAVVFTAAGLDAVVKELIRTSIKTLVSKDENVQKKLEEFTKRQISRSLGVGDSASTGFLAEILTSDNSYETLIEKYITELTGSSLQSVDELFKATAALGIDNQFIRDKKDLLGKAFETRNKIIHELDIRSDPAQVGKRNRNSRQKSEFTEQSDLFIEVAKEFISKVKIKLR